MHLAIANKVILFPARNRVVTAPNQADRATLSYYGVVQNRHSLSTKVLCLVAVPLVIQIVLFGWLAMLERTAESELSNSIKARVVSDTITTLSKDIYDGIAEFTGTTEEEVIAKSDRFQELIDDIRADYKLLKAQTANEDDINRKVEKSEKAAEQSLLTVVEIVSNTKKFGSDARDMNNPLWDKLHHQMGAIDYRELTKLGKQQKKLANQAPEIEAKLRKEILTLLIFGSLTTIAMGIALAVFLTREVTGKLSVLTDNAYRLASDQPLNDELTGEDDISKLDQLFHGMAREIKQSIRKEKAIIDNAHDLILTLDQQVRIDAVNPAILTVFGYESEDVLGQNFLSFIAEKDVNKTRELFSSRRKNSQRIPAEVQLLKKNGEKADIVLSVSWSDEQKKYFAVAHDMTERRQSERLKEEVVAMVTHDLRTPLFTIQNILGFLSQDLSGKVEKRLSDYILMAESNTERMLRLINDLIDSEKMRAEAMQPKFENVELNKCFEGCRQVVAALAEDGKIALNFSATDIIVKADPVMLERALFNLVANAIKFSPKGAKVNVTAQTVDNQAEISIEDNGPGIAEDQQKDIFERFKQGTNRSTKAYASSGLGLSIAKAFIELQHGKIWVVSSVGNGSTFRFTLMLA